MGKRPARAFDPAARAQADKGNRVLVAAIGAPHGVRGEVRLRSFTADPMAVMAYGTLEAEDGRSFRLESARPSGKDVLVVRFAGIADRDAAERLRGIQLFVPRARLPAIEEPETFYHADLIGLLVVGPDGAALGTVAAIQNFGAGDLVEIRPPQGPTMLLPFTEEVVPVVDVAGGKLVVNPPLQGEGRRAKRAGVGPTAQPSEIGAGSPPPAAASRRRPPPSRGR